MSTIFGDLSNEHMILRAGWDNVVTSPVKLEKTGSYFANQDMPLVLSDVTIRKESFGVVVRKGISTYHFDQDASDVLSEFYVPSTLNCIFEKRQTINQQHQKRIVELVEACLQTGILEIAADTTPSQVVWHDYPNISTTSSRNYFRMPLGIEIELTNKCHRKCSYCAYESGPNPVIPRDQEMSVDEWIEVLDLFAKHAILFLEFTGGDPFAREDAFEIIEFADDKGFILYINSDLSVLSDYQVQKLGKIKNLASIQTSLDGAKPASADFTRGKGSFKTTIRQIEKLGAAKLPVSIGSTIHNQNFDEVYEIAKIAGSYGAKFYIGPMYAAGRGVLLAQYTVSEAHWAVSVSQYMEAIRNGVVEPADQLWYTLLDHQGNPAKDQVFLTHAADRCLRIDPRGHVYVTAKLRQQHPRFWSIGNLLVDELADIWHNSPLLQELRSYPVANLLFGGVDVRKIKEDVDVLIEERG